MNLTESGTRGIKYSILQTDISRSLSRVPYRHCCYTELLSPWLTYWHVKMSNLLDRVVILWCLCISFWTENLRTLDTIPLMLWSCCPCKDVRYSKFRHYWCTERLKISESQTKTPYSHYCVILTNVQLRRKLIWWWMYDTFLMCRRWLLRFVGCLVGYSTIRNIEGRLIFEASERIAYTASYLHVK